LITSNSHAACYAFIAYQTAWLKRYYRHEFMACLLTSELGDDKKVGEYIGEARRLGIRVLAPNINKSGRSFDIQPDGDIRAPLTIVKGVGEKAVSVIVEARGGTEFASLRDFVVRTNSREVTSKMVELLIDAGSFASFDEDREALKLKLVALKKEIKTQKFDPSEYSGGRADKLFGSIM
jgi:DNA polymerase-3 subunit alpha